MTNEEAIKGLEGLARNFSGYKPNEEMFDMAIAALKAQPCEGCVRREDVLEIISDFGYKNTHEEMLINARIKALPPVTPKPRMGKWIKVVTETDSFGNETYHHECSVCRCNKSGWGEYRFCPNCGAKMEGESE